LMGIDASNGQTDNPTKKKTTNQLQSLEKFYSGVTFPYPILLSKDYILKKIFRKDGPTLGFEFDAAPGNAVGYHTELQEPEPCHGKLQTAKRSKRQSSQRKSQERRKSTRIGKVTLLLFPMDILF
ncbi:hypothetical protein B296_00038793, partial [Ensete ventricosum]